MPFSASSELVTGIGLGQQVHRGARRTGEGAFPGLYHRAAGGAVNRQVVSGDLCIVLISGLHQRVAIIIITGDSVGRTPNAITVVIASAVVAPVVAQVARMY